MEGEEEEKRGRNTRQEEGRGRKSSRSGGRTSKKRRGERKGEQTSTKKEGAFLRGAILGLASRHALPLILLPGQSSLPWLSGTRPPGVPSLPPLPSSFTP